MACIIDAVMIDKDGFFVGLTPVQENPKEPGKFLLPEDCLLISPPVKIREGYKYKLTKNNTWKEIKDQSVLEKQALSDKELQHQRLEWLKKNALLYKDCYFEVSELFLHALERHYTSTDKSAVRHILQDGSYGFVLLNDFETAELIEQLKQKLYSQYFS